MNVGIGTVAAQFPFRKYLFQIFGTVSLQCTHNMFTRISARFFTVIYCHNNILTSTKYFILFKETMIYSMLEPYSVGM
jgi:hypothetical protein